MPSAVEEGSGQEYVDLERDSQNTEATALASSPPRTTVASPREATSPPPQLASLPPPPRIPPARRSRRQPSASPNRRSLLRARRSRGLTPFDRVANAFAAVERRRLEFEVRRDRHLHEQELRKLEVDREHNQLLHQLALLGQRLVDVLTQQRSRPQIPDTV